jgi:hypothetical protein
MTTAVFTTIVDSIRLGFWKFQVLWLYVQQKTGQESLLAGSLAISSGALIFLEN